MKYNLVEEKWIQARDLHGKTAKYSLVELFEEAHQLQEIFFESPVEEIAVNRFLQTLVVIITECTTEEEIWEEVFNKGKFEIEEFKNYFEEHFSGFDLFDSERPFYQHHKILGNFKRNPISVLFQDVSSANNAILFDHGKDDYRKWVGLDRVAVGLITSQGYSFGGGISKPSNFRGAPGSGASAFWIKGKNLFESILFNSPFIPDFEELGEPAWERALPLSENRPYEGYADYLTWQSRRLKIYLPDEINGNNYNIEQRQILCTTDASGFSIGRCQGDYQDDENIRDPLFAYRINEKKKKDIVTYPYKLQENREAWRDSEIYYAAFSDDKPTIWGEPPVTISYLKNSTVVDTEKFDVNVYTVNNSNGQPKIILWRRVVMPFYPALMKNKENDKSHLVSSLLQKVEAVAKTLYFAGFEYGKIIKHKNAYVPEISVSTDERKEINGIAAKLNLETNYWAELEKPFYKQLEYIAGNDDFDEIELKESWRKLCFKTALRIFDEAVDNSESENFKAHQIARNKFFYTKKGDE